MITVLRGTFRSMWPTLTLGEAAFPCWVWGEKCVSLFLEGTKGVPRNGARR